MRVWLADKPSFARELGKVLGNMKTVPGYRNVFDTDGGRIVCAAGHLLELAEPAEYRPEWKEWSVEHIPMLPDPWKISLIKGKEAWIDEIEKGMEGYTEIVVATDAGREGEYIAYLILTYLGVDLKNTPMKRLWSSGADAASISKAITNLLPYTQKYMLAKAAEIRAQSDWVEGINLTRLFSERFRPYDHDGPISVGRVQTAVLALIVRRQREIDTFKALTYYDLIVDVEVDGHRIRLHHKPSEDKRITDAAEARRIAGLMLNRSGPIDIFEESRVQRPPSLFESSSLQIRAFNLWGWTADRTEGVAQSLYDEHKLITYPRTDGIHLDDGQWSDVPNIISNIATTTGFGAIPMTDDERFKDIATMVPQNLVKRPDVFSSKSLSESGADHHGIIPTSERADLSRLTEEERKLYALIVRQYLAQFMPDCLYIQKRMSWTGQGYPFSANGRSIKTPGWRMLFGKADDKAENDERPEDQEENVVLPEIRKGSLCKIIHPLAVQKTTKAPKSFTDGSLVAAMRDLTLVIKDPEKRSQLKHAASLGTKSTWGDTIKKLWQRVYIYKHNGKIKPTALGEDLVALCEKHVPQLVDPVNTALLELMLIMVEQGKTKVDKAKTIIQIRNEAAIKTCKELPDQKLRAPAGGAGASKRVAKAGGTFQPKPFEDFPAGSYEIDVSYDDKEKRDRVKSMGGRFNGVAKKWHVAKDSEHIPELEKLGWIKQ